MAQGTKFQISFLYLRLIHFMSASLTSVIVSGGDRLTADNTGREITTATSACSIIFTYWIFAVLSWAFYHLARWLFRRMLREYAHGNINVFLSFLWSAHAFKLHESSWTLLIALFYLVELLCYSRRLGQQLYKFSLGPYQAHSLLI